MPRVVGFGERGFNPATRESFILMEELTPVTSLEDYCADWRMTPPPFALKIHLIRQVAESPVRCMRTVSIIAIFTFVIYCWISRSRHSRQNYI